MALLGRFTAIPKNGVGVSKILRLTHEISLPLPDPLHAMSSFYHHFTREIVCYWENECGGSGRGRWVLARPIIRSCGYLRV